MEGVFSVSTPKNRCSSTCSHHLASTISWRPTSYKGMRSHMSVQASNILSLSIAVLKKNEDPKVVESLVTLLRELLHSVKSARSEKAHRLVSLGGVPLLLQTLVKVSKCPTTYRESTIASLFYVLSVIGKKDIHFRSLCLSCGVVSVTLKMLDLFASKPNLLQSVLLFLKTLTVKSPTVSALVSEGLIPLLHKILLANRKRSYGHLPSSLTTLYILQAICFCARSSRQAVTQLLSSDKSFLKTALSLLDPCSWSGLSEKKSPRMARIFKSILNIFMHISATKPGRKAMLESSTIPILLEWGRGLPNRILWNRHAILVSLVIQRCLPPLLLPLTPSKFRHPINFPLPPEEDEFDLPNKNFLESDEETLDESSTDSESSDEEAEKSTSSSRDFRSQLGDEELCAYAKFFEEFRCASHHSKANQIENEKKDCHGRDIFESQKISVSEKKHLYKSARESLQRDKLMGSLDPRDLHREFCKKTRHLVPWVIAPESSCPITTPLGNGRPLKRVECLYDQPSILIKCKLFEHVTQRVKTELEGKASLRKLAFSLDPFLNTHSKDDLFTFQNGLSTKDNYTVPSGSDQLNFESRFECGNLRKAFMVGERQYDLILNPDINTDYHHQWFYFRVTGMKSDGKPYLFNIINCEKSSSLFNSGMQPVLYSEKESCDPNGNGGWFKAGSDICYFRNHYTRQTTYASIIKDRPFYTLTFSITFPHQNDVCYLAYFYPYSYSLLKTHLYCWEHSHDCSNIYFQQQELCKTLLGNSVPLLTITAKPLKSSRPYIFLTSRVHPGESNSSWMLKGVIDHLLGDKCNAQKLREMFVFKILPMLNPDGVINGCDRCSLSGCDLNRQWASPSCLLHPPIFHSKALIQHLCAHRGPPLVYCDFHGHSRHNNVFLYGCNPLQSWLRKDRQKVNDKAFSILPELLSNSAPAFSLEDCSFEIEAGKEATARVTVWRQFKVPLSYTMECTFAGCDRGTYAGQQLGIQHMIEMGMKFCQALLKLET